jgi:hypothetical protein
MINYYINSKRIYIDENDYSIIFINKTYEWDKPQVDINSKPHVDINSKPQVDINSKPQVDINSKPHVDINSKPHVDINSKPHVDINSKPQAEPSNKVHENLVYTLDNSYYNFSIKSSQLEESMIVFK